jgi:hypothetical protein
MSLDNVLGVAAAAKGNVVLLVVGLVISIPLIIYGSTIILKLMNRWPLIITIGGGILGWVAGEMLVTDPSILPWVDTNAHWLHIAAPIAATLGVVAIGKWMAAAAIRRGEQVALDTIMIDGDEAPPPGYHWVTRPWRLLPDGTRDYAALHGVSHFRSLEPISSHLKPARRS